ncbi:MAG: ATP synthase F1 subunit epsilon [Spirochaetota bacterium]
MERKISCNVLTPDGQVYNGEVDLAIVPGAQKGEMGFLYNHAPLIAALGLGEVRLTNGNHKEYLVVEGGFVEIINNKLSIFPMHAYKRSDLYKEGIEKEIKKLQEQEKPKDPVEREKIAKEIQKLKIQLKVSKK